MSESVGNEPSSRAVTVTKVQQRAAKIKVERMQRQGRTAPAALIAIATAKPPRKAQVPTAVSA